MSKSMTASRSRLLPSLSPVDAVACCSPLCCEPVSEQQANQIVPLLKALADPVRLRLMSLVASQEDGEACICDLNPEFDLSQPTISHHLKLLHDAGLLDREKRGVWVYYRARTEVLQGLSELIGIPPDTAALPSAPSLAP